MVVPFLWIETHTAQQKQCGDFLWNPVEYSIDIRYLYREQKQAKHKATNRESQASRERGGTPSTTLR